MPGPCPLAGGTMSYEQVAKLLNPEEFLRLQAVRQHLLKDPTALDNRPESVQLSEENTNAKQVEGQ